MIVATKISRDFFPCIHIVKAPIGWRTSNKTIVLVIWTRFLIDFGPEELATFTASLPAETDPIE
jgi:hypothetical protein